MEYPGYGLAAEQGRTLGVLYRSQRFAQEASPKKLKAVHSRHGYLQMTVGRFIAEPSVSSHAGRPRYAPSERVRAPSCRTIWSPRLSMPAFAA